MKTALIFLIVTTVLMTPTVSMAANLDHQEVNLLPQPQSVEWFSGETNVSRVVLDDSRTFADVQLWLKDCGIEVDAGAETVMQIRFVEAFEDAKVNPHEAYRLRVSGRKVEIEATSSHGVFNAVQTLRQLLSESSGQLLVPHCAITDWPAFSIRGFMHDVGRSFMPLEELKDQIKLLSKFKINTFHWHLTEDIAWRLESEVFPELTDSLNFSRLPGQYYRKEEVRDLMDFCAQHHVLLIPEIDMPGHSASFTRALGHDMQSAQGMALLKKLMEEICELFEGLPYLHIGTDEVAFTNPDFVPEMVAFIRDRGMKVISWNPGWNYGPDEIDMLQLWSSRGKLHQGIPAIDSRYHYINHFDVFADIVGLYHSNIGGVPYQTPEMAGAIIGMWNDRFVDTVEENLNQNNFYPSMLTLAERSWQGGGEEYISERGVGMAEAGTHAHASFLDFEERMLQFKEKLFRDLPFPYVRQSNIHWHISEPFFNEGDLSKVFPIENDFLSQPDVKPEGYSYEKATGATIYLRHVWGSMVPAFFKQPEPNHTVYAYTRVYVNEPMRVGLYAGFQNYSRSESDLPPPQGSWDYNNSRIWLNGAELLPPVWENNHTTRSSEILLRNENWEARPPIPVQLKKGWNNIFIKLPVGAFTRKEVRLVKWMFTCVIVTPDGKNAVDSIYYSPDKTIKP